MSIGFTSLKFGLEKNIQKLESQKDFKSAFLLRKFKNNFWTAIPNTLLFDENISDEAKIFWMLLEEAGDADGYSYYAQKKLAIIIGKSIKSIQRYDTKLTKTGWLITKPGKIHRSKDYYVIWPPGCPNPKWKSAIKKSKMQDKRY